MPMGKGYSHKMAAKGKKSSNAKSHGGDKGSMGLPVDSSAKAAMQSGYGKANVKGSRAKTFC